MKHKAKQVDIKWGEPEAFALIAGTTTDGGRVAKEKCQQEKDRVQADARQTVLLPE